jgi:hypothetical protein
MISILTIAIILYAELTTRPPGAGLGSGMVVSRVLTALVGKIRAMTAGKHSVRRWLVELQNPLITIRTGEIGPYPAVITRNVYNGNIDTMLSFLIGVWIRDNG